MNLPNFTNEANATPANLQAVSKHCLSSAFQELIPYARGTMDAKVNPFEFSKQPVFIIEPSPLSSTFIAIPEPKYIVYQLKNYFIFCPEMESPEEINWVWPSWEKQCIYHQITIEGSYRKAIEKISTFKNLSPNWDSFKAKSIDSSCISRASKILIDLSEWMTINNIPSPFVAPRSDGSIQMEWESGMRYFELGINPDLSRIDFLVMDENPAGEQIELEGVLESEESIKELLHWFISGKAYDIKQLFAKIK